MNMNPNCFCRQENYSRAENKHKYIDDKLNISNNRQKFQAKLYSK